MLATINHYMRHILATVTLLVFVGLVIMVEQKQDSVQLQTGMDVVIKVNEAHTLESIQDSLRFSTSQPVENHDLGDNNFLLRVRCRPEQRLRLMSWLLKQEGVERADLVE